MQNERREVIVGIDGSEHARRALAWAVAKTDVLGPITPVMAYAMQPLGDGLGMPAMYFEIDRVVKEDAEERIQATLEDFPAVADRARLVRHQAGPALVRAAAESSLLVVGSRGRGAVAETLFGSVGSYCVKHATVPVAVITDGDHNDPTINRAVVGIDGSPNSAVALDWALRHVDPAGEVLAVGCWTDHVFGEPPLPNSELEASTATMVEGTIAMVRTRAGEAVGPAATIETLVRRGDPRIVLRELAQAADLLIIGARGHRGVSYLLLGSTTTSLLHHPLSPTVVVPLGE